MREPIAPGGRAALDVVAGATVLRLHEALARAFPGCCTNHTRAAAKLHLVLSVLAGPRSVSITGERVSERRRLNIGSWVRGRLLLFDLGYFKWQLFARIHENRGSFVSRLRDDVNPIIVAENRRWRGASRKLAGRRLPDVKDGLARREPLDLASPPCARRCRPPRIGAPCHRRARGDRVGDRGRPRRRPRSRASSTGVAIVFSQQKAPIRTSAPPR